MKTAADTNLIERSRASAAWSRLRSTPANSPRPGVRGSAPVFAALGDETRLALVARLCASGALTITELAQDSGVTRQAVTKHLHVLESAGVARGRRRGRTQMWELRARPLDEARRTLDRIAREWHGALARRKDAVEGDG